jgi:hypothetical protein
MMSSQQGRILELLIRLAPIVIGIGIAIGSTTAALHDRVEVTRFVAESIRTAAWQEWRDARLVRIEDGIALLNARLSQIYCRGNPDPSCR